MVLIAGVRVRRDNSRIGDIQLWIGVFHTTAIFQPDHDLVHLVVRSPFPVRSPSHVESPICVQASCLAGRCGVHQACGTLDAPLGEQCYETRQLQIRCGGRKVSRLGDLQLRLELYNDESAVCHSPSSC